MSDNAEKDVGRLTERERELLYAPDRRMDAYYYGFDPTGVSEIDAILSAVAHAGKGYHHTDSWADDPGECGRYGPGRSMVDVIQAAANEAALAWEARVIPHACPCTTTGQHQEHREGSDPLGNGYPARVLPPGQGTAK